MLEGTPCIHRSAWLLMYSHLCFGPLSSWLWLGELWLFQLLALDLGVLCIVGSWLLSCLPSRSVPLTSGLGTCGHWLVEPLAFDVLVLSCWPWCFCALWIWALYLWALDSGPLALANWALDIWTLDGWALGLWTLSFAFVCFGHLSSMHLSFASFSFCVWSFGLWMVELWRFQPSQSEWACVKHNLGCNLLFDWVTAGIPW